MGTQSWWSRTDNRFLEGALVVAAVLAAIFGVLLPALGVAGAIDPMDTREVQIGTATRVPGSVTEGTGGHGMTLTGTDHADLTIAHPGLGERLLLALPEVVGSLLLLVILGLLIQMARTLRDGDVFVPRNARRLSAIGIIVLVQAILSPILPTITTALLVRGTPMAAEIPVSATFTGEFVLLAFLILALGEVFRRGTRLRADTEGLV
ncbi:DUF2975 domain-containing protein [Streptomyces sp. NPDC058045]|uniref:DUF2975 domain-containing protein n=1 Tax=Streptomyces sp. NPDC058045 TaxID=3346311 RepID=UPI0036EDDF9C